MADDRPTTAGNPPGHRTAVAARVAVVCLAALALGFSVAHGHRATTAETSRPSVVDWTRFTDQEECIYRAIRSELPAGATVHVVTAVAYDRLRLIELTTGWAEPTRTSAPASWTIGIVPGASCAGVSLDVRRT